MDYGTGDVVEFNKIVEIEDLLSGSSRYCTVVENLTIETLFEMINSKPVCEDGKIWVHTPLGGALLGKKNGEVVEYSVCGAVKKCKINKIFS